MSFAAASFFSLSFVWESARGNAGCARVSSWFFPPWSSGVEGPISRRSRFAAAEGMEHDDSVRAAGLVVAPCTWGLVGPAAHFVEG
jgi:hypothetical protein